MNMLAMNFEGQDVRTIMRGDMPWWVNKDVCKVLEISNPRHASSRLDEDEKGVVNNDTLGGSQELAIINESGLYSLILTSRKPAAKRFKKWVTSEVLPSIRKDGFYCAEKKPDNMPSNSDDVVFGVKVTALNAAARTASIIERIYGAEAARSLWELDSRLPQVANKCISFSAQNEKDDPEKCLMHLLNADCGDGTTIAELLIMGRNNISVAKKLKNYGVVIYSTDHDDFTAIMNQNRFLASVFANTHWCLEWYEALLLLEGAKLSGKTSGFNGRKNSAVFIPKYTIDKVISNLG